MTADDEKPSVLVVLATGKMGSGIIDAFLASDKKYVVYGTSRNPTHPRLLAKGVTPVGFRFGDKDSMIEALQVSKASVVVLITGLINISKTRETEVAHGKIMIDACKEVGTPHVIFCSVNLAETAPEGANHLKSKLEIEQYLKSAGLPCYSILRPGSFFENYDDPTVMNPLKRGYLSDLYPGHAKVPHVATLDIGKAAVVMANHRALWRNKTVACVSSCDSGDDVAAILSDASGVDCTYRAAPPRFVLKFFLPELYHMVNYVSDGMKGYSVQDDIRCFRAVVPDMMGPREWFVKKGAWSDGSRFNEPPPPSKSNATTVFFALLAVLAAFLSYSYGWRS